MRNTKVTEYINGSEKWKNILAEIRDAIIKLIPEEEYKWGRPCYYHDGKPVVGFSGFKNHFGIWFFQGMYLQDKAGLLENAQEGKTVAMRQMKFTNSQDVDIQVVRKYIQEALQNAKDGKFYKPQKRKLIIPNLLEQGMKNDKSFKAAFNAFSESDKIDFAEYVTTAKRESTQLRRLEKIKEMVLRGEGLNDKYKKC